ncbi:uncharacterized protein F5147DRAFT_656395 [Suillus discolor]|uniref:Uncharacterized protein n=1 Tax=Suillus discolor TaxID=1912936 RepID=A0A9P7JQ11_9AGAM|nr:uncharacterized protein F5147DRAFT_656395 [Suillus discolor]KAG2097261.1 hypothetical protein F5147DRAFT_656395 [Suillus discolor]
MAMHNFEDLLQFRQFKVEVCNAYNTQELDREADVRTRRQAKEAGRRVEKGGANGKEEGATAQQPKAGTNTKERQQKPAPIAESNEAASDPYLHHHIGQSEKVFDELGHYLRNNARDLAMKTGDENMGNEQNLLANAHWRQAANGEADEEDEDHVGIEELIPFEQGCNGSTEMLIDALDKWYTDYMFDYEN